MTIKESCPPGYVCLDPASSPSQCASGYYSNENATSCIVCPVGYACPGASVSPYRCPGGTYVSGTGKSQCETCMKGYQCNSSSVLPIRCQLGQYSPLGASSCFDCPAGFYCPD